MERSRAGGHARSPGLGLGRGVDGESFFRFGCFEAGSRAVVEHARAETTTHEMRSVVPVPLYSAAFASCIGIDGQSVVDMWAIAR